MLAYRALKNGEKPGWPLAIFLLALFEISLLLQTLWIFDYTNAFLIRQEYPALYWLLDFIFKYALPVLCPSLFLASCVAWPTAAWRARREERLAIAAGGQPWTRSRRCKRGLAWYGVVAAVLLIFILPAPMFLFCALTTETNAYCPSRKDYRTILARITPNFIRDSIDALLNNLWAEKHFVLAYQGFISKERLLYCMNQKNIDHYTYFRSLALYYPCDALPIAHDICNDKWLLLTPSGRRHLSRFIGVSLDLIAKFEDAKALRHCLNNVKFSGLEFSTKALDAFNILTLRKTIKDDQINSVMRRMTVPGSFLTNIGEDMFIRQEGAFVPAVQNLLDLVNNSDLTIRRSAAYILLNFFDQWNVPCIESPDFKGAETPFETQEFRRILGHAGDWIKGF
jgi:hypothetical protein